MDVIINSKIVVILAINNNTLNMCVQLNHYRPTLWHLCWCWKNTSESESKFYFVEDCCWGGILSSNLSEIQSPPRADPKSMQDSARRVFRGMAWKREFACQNPDLYQRSEIIVTKPGLGIRALGCITWELGAQVWFETLGDMFLWSVRHDDDDLLPMNFLSRGARQWEETRGDESQMAIRFRL